MDNYSICWDCRRAIPDKFGCSWAKSFVPVDGWKAELRNLRVSNAKVKTVSTSYKVFECPLFLEDGDEDD